MVHRCCISSCGMSVRVLEAKGLSYHKFPTKEPMRDQWVQAIIPHLDKPESFKVVPRYTRVCSRHFRKKDYCMDAKKRARLNSNAVPSVFPRKGTPVVVPTVLPVSPKSSSPKTQVPSDSAPGTSVKSENVHDNTVHGPSTAPPSSGPLNEESGCSISHLTTLEGHNLDELLGRAELFIESATIQDDHLVLTVMDPSNSNGEGHDSVSISNSDDQSQSQPSGILDETNGEGGGAKRRKRRKWNRTAFARPAKGKRKSVKQDPVTGDDDVEDDSVPNPNDSSSSASEAKATKRGHHSEVHSHEMLPLDGGASVLDDCRTSVANVTLLFSDLSNQPSVEQELLQSIQAVSLKSSGDAEDCNELQSSTTTTEEGFPYNNLVPAFLHHSSEESLFSNESHNPGGSNDYHFQTISHSQIEPDLSSTAEDDSLRFELVDLRIDSEIPSAPPPTYLDIDELAHQLNSSLFTDGKIPLFSADTLNLNGDGAANLNIAEDLFTDTTEDISVKPESSSPVEKPISSLSAATSVQPSTSTSSSSTRNESKPSPKKSSNQRAKGKPVKVNKPASLPPPKVNEKKLKGVAKRPKKDKITGKFSVERFKNSDKDIEYYTGFTTYRNFEAFFRSLEAYIEKLCITDATYGVNNLPISVDKSSSSSMNSPGEDATKTQMAGTEQPKKRSCQGRAMSRINELFMTIIRLRRKLPEKVLGHMFFISQPTVSRVVRAWTVLLSKIIDSYPVESSSSSSKPPHKEHSYTNKGLGIPEVFRELFYSDLAKSIVVTSLNPKKVKSKCTSSSVRNKKSKMSITSTCTDSSSHLSDSGEDKSGDVDSDFFIGVNPNTASPIQTSSVFDF